MTQPKQRKERKRLTIAALAALVVGPLIYAANVHFKRNPTFTDNGTTLTTWFSLAGLGNEVVTITLNASRSTEWSTAR